MLRLLIICLAIAIVPLSTSYHLEAKNTAESLNIDVKLSENITATVLRNQFTILKQLGRGRTSQVYVVKKLGGSDDGKLYALKVINLLPENKPNPTKSFYDEFIAEREILETVRELPFAINLHYAWREGKWLFMVLDLLTNGDALSGVEANLTDTVTTKKVLAEAISIIEKLHKAGILHQDAVLVNFLIDDEGHLVLTDFGASKLYSDDKSSHWDWKCIHFTCVDVFPEENRDVNQINLLNLLKNMTDAKLPELKNQAYFDGIDWDMLADGRSDAPFNPNNIQINLKTPTNLADLLETAINDEHEPIRAEYYCNFSYIAPEHQN